MRRTNISSIKVAAIFILGVASLLTQAADSTPSAHPPAVNIFSPPDGAVFTAPIDIHILAEATDVDGQVKSVEFFAGTNSLGVVTNEPIAMSAELQAAISASSPDLPPLPKPSAPYRLIWTNAPPGDYTLMALAKDDQGLAAVSGPVRITINKPELALPIVTIVATDPVASEGPPGNGHADTAAFTVSRTGSTVSALEVHYRVGGTATNGIDYRELVGTVTVPAGAKSADIIVDPIDDGIAEGTETVVITLEPHPCDAVFPLPPECYLVGRQNEAKAEIRDNDKPSTNRAPFIAMVRPVDEQVFAAPADVSLVAMAWDFDGMVSSVEFFEGDHSLGVVTNKLMRSTRPPKGDDRDMMPSPLFEFTWTNVPPGRFVLTAEAKDNLGATTRSKPIEINVITKVSPPIVTIEATDAEAAEEGAGGPTPNTATFTIHRTGETNFPMVVQYRLSGTATPGKDYQDLPGTVTIPEGARSADLIIKPIDDNLVEGKETVIATLLPPVCIQIFPPPRDCYVVGKANQARAVILDNDSNPTNLPPKVAIVSPKAGDVFFEPADIDLLAAAKDADGKIKSVEFFEGKNSLGMAMHEDGDGDGDDDDNLFRLKWPNVKAGDYVLTAVATDDLDAKTVSDSVAIKVTQKPVPPPIVTIKAIDGVATEASSLAAGASSSGNAATAIAPDTGTFAVYRTGDTNIALVVSYSVNGTAQNGIDYEKLSGDVTIPKGAASAEILVKPIDDQLPEETETVVLTILPRACGDVSPPPADCYRVGEAKTATVYLRDNDTATNAPPKVALTKPAPKSVFNVGANIELRAEAVDRDGWVGLVEFFEGKNKIGEQNIVFIKQPPPGLSQVFEVKWTNVPAGTYSLTAKATDDRGASSISDAVQIAVIDGKLIPVVNVSATDAEASEGDATAQDAKTAIFKVTRTGSTNNALVVNYKMTGAAKNGVDYIELSGKVSIAAGALSAEIVIQPIDDKDVEGTEDIILTLLPPDCGDAFPPSLDCYIIGKDNHAVALLKDNDAAASSAPEVAITEPHDGAFFKAQADISINADTRDPDGWVQRVEFMANDKKIGELVMEFIQAPPPGQKQSFSFKWTNVPPAKYLLSVRATDNTGVSSLSKPVSIQVGETNATPVVTIQALDAHAAEENGSSGNPNPATFRVRRAGSLDSELKVYYSISGTASNSVDYATLPGTLTIPAGAKSADIMLTPIDDKIEEPTETVVLKLEPPPSATSQNIAAASYLIGKPDKAAATIEDNDGPHKSCVHLHDGHFMVCMPGMKGESFRIEASIDLVHWEIIEHNTAVEDEMHFVDADAPDHPHRYYRVIRTPGESSDE